MPSFQCAPAPEDTATKRDDLTTFGFNDWSFREILQVPSTTGAAHSRSLINFVFLIAYLFIRYQKMGKMGRKMTKKDSNMTGMGKWRLPKRTSTIRMKSSRSYLSQCGTCINRIDISKFQGNLFLADSKLIQSAQLTVVPTVLVFEKYEIDKQFSKEVIERGHTGLAASIVLASLKESSLLFCVDYRKLEAVTRGDILPTLRVNKYIDALRETAVIFTVGANSWLCWV